MKKDASPALTVIIPTWNGWELLRTCLESLIAQRFEDMEIIVVDDGSTDDTPARLQADFPEVRCVVSTENRGFAPAVNLGLLEARGAWVFLLNNDVTLEAGCIEKLMACARVGKYQMITPMVVWTEEPERIYSAGDTVGPAGRPSSLGFKMSLPTYIPKGEPFGVSGGYSLFQKAMLDEIGVLDETFVAYFEDSDLCFRARWAGYAATLVTDARARHIGSASVQGRTWWRTRQCFQNHALLVLKNYSFPLLRRNLGPVLRERRHQWGRLLSAARHEWGAFRALGFVLVAWLGLLFRVPYALRARRSVLRTRALSDEAMQDLLEKE
jgi:GT2 family glycosyltransferase